MKLGIGILIFSFFASATSPKFIFDFEPENAEWRVFNALDGDPDSDNMYSYQTDKCEVVSRLVANEIELRDKGLRRCLDQTVSFVQPKSRGVEGWEGKCGQTSAANMLYMHCRLVQSPEAFDRVMGDVTPGVHPRTLRRGLKKVYSQYSDHCPDHKWSKSASNGFSQFVAQGDGQLRAIDFRNSISRRRENGDLVIRSPLASLIRTPGSKTLPWVTIVDIQGQLNNSSCKMIINHWDDQFEVPCSKMGAWSKGVSETYPVILKKYTLVHLN